MARQITWTLKAQLDRLQIFSYWNNRNKSNRYSKKLNDLIKITLKLIAKYPGIGKSTDIKNIRVKVLKDYLIIYEVNPNEIIILTIWDCRQNPDDLKRLLK
jgi:toxin YoeB